MNLLFTPSELSRFVNLDRRTAVAKLRKLNIEPAGTVNGRPVYGNEALLLLLADSPQARRRGFAVEPFVPDNSPVNMLVAKVS
jgi:hypothetical protein